MIVAVCVALAYATELSDSTFSASAALIGAATFALTSDIAARSGSASPVWASSSSIVSWVVFIIVCSSSLRLDGLVDRRHLLCVGERCRASRQDIRRERQVDRQRQVRVHERHRRPLRKPLALLTSELCKCQFVHRSPPFVAVPYGFDGIARGQTAPLWEVNLGFSRFFGKLPR